MAACAANAALVIRQNAEFSTTAYRRLANQTTVVPIPAGFQARMKFTPSFGDAFTPFTLTSSPAAGLTINYGLGQIAIYIGGTVTATYPIGLQLNWIIEIYDPAVANSVVYLGDGTAVVKAG